MISPLGEAEVSLEGHPPLSQGGFPFRCPRQKSSLVRIPNLGVITKGHLCRVPSSSLWVIQCMLRARVLLSAVRLRWDGMPVEER